jgi:UDP-N-acetylglucosamine acyltransferase
MPHVDATAIIGNDVNLGNDVSIGAFSVIGDDVTVGSGTKIDSYAVIRSGTRIGSNCTVGNFAAIGGFPQYDGFDINIPISSGVVIGNNNRIGSYVVINRSSKNNSRTVVGNDCTFHKGSKVAHDCVVGDGTIMDISSTLGGKVSVGRGCFFGKKAATEYGIAFGDYSMMEDDSATALDLPPYAVIGCATILTGINFDGLRRANVSDENVAALEACFNEFYGRTGPVKMRAKGMIREGYGTTFETKNFLRFFLVSMKRGATPKRGVDRIASKYYH